MMDKVQAEHLAQAFQKRMEEAQLFSNRFGSFSKSDYEILMFTVFQDTLAEPMRDYDLSIALGITESKARSLRIKSQLVYPRKLDWVQAIEKALSHGYYDPTTKQITITLDDPSIQSCLKNMIEERCGIVGQTLNRSQLVLPVESFLLLASFAEENPDEVIKKLNQMLQRNGKNQGKIEKKAFTARPLKTVSDLAKFVEAAAGLYLSGQNIVANVLKLLV